MTKNLSVSVIHFVGIRQSIALSFRIMGLKINFKINNYFVNKFEKNKVKNEFKFK